MRASSQTCPSARKLTLLSWGFPVGCFRVACVLLQKLAPGTLTAPNVKACACPTFHQLSPPWASSRARLRPSILLRIDHHVVRHPPATTGPDHSPNTATTGAQVSLLAVSKSTAHATAPVATRLAWLLPTELAVTACVHRRPLTDQVFATSLVPRGRTACKASSSCLSSTNCHEHLPL